MTLQPVRRFPKLDGAIIFCDILVVLDALGCGVSFPEGGTAARPDPSTSWIRRGPLDERVFEPVQAALRKVRAALPEHVALLGFAGAPWTLFAYGVEGKGSRNWTRAKTLLHTRPDIALPLARPPGGSLGAAAQPAGGSRGPRPCSSSTPGPASWTWTTTGPWPCRPPP